MNEIHKVAYLITYVSYNCIFNLRGTKSELELKDFFLSELSEYIINNSSTKFNVIEDVEQFWLKYDGYLVWKSSYVKNNEWIDIVQTNEDILARIKELSMSVESIDLEKNNYDYIEKTQSNEEEQTNEDTDECSEDKQSNEDIDIDIDWEQICKQEILNSDGHYGIKSLSSLSFSSSSN
jgi:hypothetical protein